MLCARNGRCFASLWIDNYSPGNPRNTQLYSMVYYDFGSSPEYDKHEDQMLHRLQVCSAELEGEFEIILLC